MAGRRPVHRYRLLWQAAYPAIRPMLSAAPGGIVLVAGFGATLGFSAGLVEALILRQDVAPELPP